jgi:hypothetical protein
MGPGAKGALLGAGVLAAAGCSTVLGVDPDRYLASEDEGGEDQDGPAILTEAWACTRAPMEVLDPALHVDLKLVVMDATRPATSVGSIDGGSDLDTVSGDWLSGVSVRPCALLDPGCLEAPAPVLTDDAGRAEFHLTGDFAGFFDIRRSDLVPATLYPGHFLASQSMVSFPAYGITPAGAQGLAAATRTPLNLSGDSGMGTALVTIYDCQDHQAAGVSYSYDNLGPHGVPFYFTGGLPDTSVTETDAYGLGGAANVPVGTMKVTARLVDTTTVLGSASFGVRAGSLTFAWVRVRSH